MKKTILFLPLIAIFAAQSAKAEIQCFDKAKANPYVKFIDLSNYYNSEIEFGIVHAKIREVTLTKDFIAVELDLNDKHLQCSSRSESDPDMEILKSAVKIGTDISISIIGGGRTTIRVYPSNR